MTFWQTSDNTTVQAAATAEMGGGNIEPIPSGTQLKACIDEIKWDTYQNDRYISARWTVLDGEFKNRKIFHKIRVEDTDSKKRDKALRMLAAIDTNAGGKLMASQATPDDGALASALCMRPMAIKVQVWIINDDPNDIKKGNWVQAVSPLGQQAAPAVTVPVAAPVSGDVPF